MEIVRDFIFLGCKITADGDCSHEIKKKSYDQPRQHIKKQRHYFANKGPSSQRIAAFEMWCWRRLLRVPWSKRGSNQSILKEIRPEYSLEGLNIHSFMKLKLQYFGHMK